MPSLKEKLAQALAQANAQPGSPQKVPLGRGLVIQLYTETDGQVHLLLKRWKVFPSDLEWQAVIKHWPHPLPEPRPTYFEQKVGNWYALTGNWTQPPRLFELTT